CFSPFKLKLCCVLSEGSISAELQYNAEVFDAGVVKQIAGYFQRLVAGVLQNCEGELGAVDILDDNERNRLLHEFNHNADVLPVEKCVHELFEDQVARS